MARLEYRLFDEAQEFPVIYYYDQIDKLEILMRFHCLYFVKEGAVYEQTSSAVEGGTYVIYVQPSQEESDPWSGVQAVTTWPGIRVELREYQDGAKVHLLQHAFDYPQVEDALLHVASDYFNWNEREWQKMSAEVDEDRHVYVYYAQPTN
jgi:hypothetical protein